MLLLLQGCAYMAHEARGRVAGAVNYENPLYSPAGAPVDRKATMFDSTDEEGAIAVVQGGSRQQII